MLGYNRDLRQKNSNSSYLVVENTTYGTSKQSADVRVTSTITSIPNLAKLATIPSRSLLYSASLRARCLCQRNKSPIHSKKGATPFAKRSFSFIHNLKQPNSLFSLISSMPICGSGLHFLRSNGAIAQPDSMHLSPDKCSRFLRNRRAEVGFSKWKRNHGGIWRKLDGGLKIRVGKLK